MDLVLELFDYFKDYLIDIALIVVFFLCIFLRYKKSILKSIHELLCLLVAAFMSKVYCWTLASRIMRNTEILSVSDRKEKVILLSIVIIFVIAAIVLNAVVRFIEKLFNLPDVKPKNKLMVVLLGAAIGVVYMGLAVLVIRAFEMTRYESFVKIAENSLIMKIYGDLLALYYPHAAVILAGGIIL